MGIFDIFLNPGRRLSHKKLDKLLREIKILSPQEREYVKGVLGGFLRDGVSKEEAKKAIRELRLNALDKIDSQETERIKQKLLGFFA